MSARKEFIELRNHIREVIVLEDSFQNGGKIHWNWIQVLFSSTFQVQGFDCNHSKDKSQKPIDRQSIREYDFDWWYWEREGNLAIGRRIQIIRLSACICRGR